MLRAVVVCTYTGNIAANQSVTAITSSDRHGNHGRTDGVLGVQAPSNGFRLEGQWASGRASGSFLSGGARTDVTAPAGATLPACFEHLSKALEALASKTSDAWLGVNA